MAELKSNKGLKNVLTFCENNGVRVHTAGFNNNDQLELDSSDTIDCKIKELNGVKYAEFSCKVNGKAQYKSLGSLYRSYLDGEEFIKPNDFKTLSDCLDVLCGKSVKLTKVEGAFAPDYTDNTKIVPITVFKVTYADDKKSESEKPKNSRPKNNRPNNNESEEK